MISDGFVTPISAKPVAEHAPSPVSAPAAGTVTSTVPPVPPAPVVERATSPVSAPVTANSSVSSVSPIPAEPAAERASSPVSVSAAGVVASTVPPVLAAPVAERASRPVPASVAAYRHRQPVVLEKATRQRRLTVAKKLDQSVNLKKVVYYNLNVFILFQKYHYAVKYLFIRSFFRP